MYLLHRSVGPSVQFLYSGCMIAAKFRIMTIEQRAVRETAELAGRGKNPGIDQIRKDGMEIVSKPVVVTDISADVVEAQFGA